MAKAETRLMDIILVPRFPAPWSYVEKEESPEYEVGFLYFTCTKQHIVVFRFNNLGFVIESKQYLTFYVWN